MPMPRAKEVVEFWSGIGPAGWYVATPDLDAEITRRFLPDWESARDGGLCEWMGAPSGALAYLIVTDQFPRNMFREDPRAFATDERARRAATTAIHHRMDMALPEPIRQFFYLPFMHAETTIDQDRCIRYLIARMPETGAENLRHARAHREIIRRFGRFPYRNAVLGRRNTAAEEQFLTDGGYGAILQALP
ncbi:MAG: hypothetical protein HLUCCA12_07555 [Rhodobacteraceae bacterium HLUCCA12]|nr:MAG: hypothetical protein HLUCCA12_07555 [Rhodobacteraceae bacterium HLUCCA12]